MSGIHGFEATDRERDQIAGQRGRDFESHRLHAIGLVGFRLHRRVRKRHVFLWHVQSHLPRHLEAGFIEARKGAARVGGLELAVDVPVAIFLELENTGAAIAADLALIGDVQRTVTGELAIEREAGKLIARYGFRG